MALRGAAAPGLPTNARSALVRLDILSRLISPTEETSGCASGSECRGNPIVAVSFVSTAVKIFAAKEAMFSASSFILVSKTASWSVVESASIFLSSVRALFTSRTVRELADTEVSCGSPEDWLLTCSGARDAPPDTAVSPHSCLRCLGMLAWRMRAWHCLQDTSWKRHSFSKCSSSCDSGPRNPQPWALFQQCT